MARKNKTRVKSGDFVLTILVMGACGFRSDHGVQLQLLQRNQ